MCSNRGDAADGFARQRRRWIVCGVSCLVVVQHVFGQVRKVVVQYIGHFGSTGLVSVAGSVIVDMAVEHSFRFCMTFQRCLV